MTNLSIVSLLTAPTSSQPGDVSAIEQGGSPFATLFNLLNQQTTGLATSPHSIQLPTQGKVSARGETLPENDIEAETLDTTLTVSAKFIDDESLVPTIPESTGRQLPPSADADIASPFAALLAMLPQAGTTTRNASAISSPQPDGPSSGKVENSNGITQNSFNTVPNQATPIESSTREASDITIPTNSGPVSSSRTSPRDARTESTAAFTAQTGVAAQTPAIFNADTAALPQALASPTAETIHRGNSQQNDGPQLPVATSVNSPLLHTSSTASAASVTTAPPFSQAPLGSPEWQQALSQQVALFSRQGVQQAELKLHPEELGQLHIKLHLEDAQMQLQIHSPHGQVRAVLEAALPTLRTSLAETGIQLGHSSVGSESFSGQQQESHSQQRNTAFTRDSGLDASQIVTSTLAAGGQHNGTRGGVDTFA
ncbi:hypothetical protein TUM12370_13960 [Salmonella enterica subsp. enterica serovar Choleraesuis]|nr:hypothetical protein TUM12370_13960 [Salmonella enterica subsp. enterica serovar Choleraesuis]